MDYPSNAARRNIHNAEGAIPCAFGTTTTEGPDNKHAGMGNPDVSAQNDCAWSVPIKHPFPKDSYKSGGNINSPDLS